MTGNFEIPIIYKGKELVFPASFMPTGYTYKIQVDVFGKMISFEPDEERNFRAVVSEADLAQQDKIDKTLIMEIAETLQTIFKD